MNSFVMNPMNYLSKIDSIPIPPLRIFVFGSLGSRRTEVAYYIAEKYKLRRIAKEENNNG